MVPCVLVHPPYCDPFNYTPVDGSFKNFVRAVRVGYEKSIKTTLNTMIAFNLQTKSHLQQKWLLAVAHSKDRTAFKALFKEFAPRVRAFILRKGTDFALAEEITQETMVSVWRKAELFDPAKASVSTWIFTIARNMRIDVLRKVHRPEPDMNDPSLINDPNPQIYEKISCDEEAERLKLVFALLPKDQQIVLKMSFFEEKAHGEIATELGIPLGTVKSRIRLAFNRLRKELGENK